MILVLMPVTIGRWETMSFVEITFTYKLMAENFSNMGSSIAFRVAMHCAYRGEEDNL